MELKSKNNKQPSTNSISKKNKVTKKDWEKVLSAIAAAVTVFAVIFSINLFFWPEKAIQKDTDKTRETISKYNESVAKLESNIAEFESYAKRLMADIDEKPQPSKLEFKIATLFSEVNSLKSDVSIINDAILDSPEKALTIPLLKKDLNNLKETFNKGLDNIEKDTTRIFDMFQWTIGLFFTLAVGILTLAIGNFVKPKKEG